MGDRARAPRVAAADRERRRDDRARARRAPGRRRGRSVVLPLPSSPLTRTTSPGRERRRRAARRAPRSPSGPSVSSTVNANRSSWLSGAARRLAARRVLGASAGLELRAAARRAAAGSLREVLAQGLEQRGRAQRGRRVEEREHEHRPPAELVHLGRPAHPGDPGLAAGDLLGREVARGSRSPAARSARSGARGTASRPRSPPAAGRGCRAAGDLRMLAMKTSSRLIPISSSSSLSSWPARPTNGRPWRSSSAPGASPTNIRSASALPAPKTDLGARPACSGQRVQPETSR